MDMEGGDSEELHKTRFEEMQNPSEKYGYSLIKISEDKVEFLSGYLESNVVDVIMVPCYFDWHPEHIEVMHILNQAAAKSRISEPNCYVSSFASDTIYVNNSRKWIEQRNGK